MIQRQGDGFPLDQSRVAYLRYLRRERRQSPRAEADAAHAKAKTELLQVRIMEKRKVLMLVTDHEALVETVVGLFLTFLSSHACAVCAAWRFADQTPP